MKSKIIRIRDKIIKQTNYRTNESGIPRNWKDYSTLTMRGKS